MWHGRAPLSGVAGTISAMTINRNGSDYTRVFFTPAAA
jgi:hypothetical protein